MVKITVRLMVRNPQTKRLKDVSVDCTVADLSFETMKMLWNVERTINERTPIRCHILIDAEPNGVTLTPEIENDSN